MPRDSTVVFGRAVPGPGMRIRVRARARVASASGRFRSRAAGGVAIDHSATFPWPRAPAAGGGGCDLSLVPARGEPGEMLYLPDLPAGWRELGRPGKPAFRLEWDESVLPHLWLWQELGTTSGYRGTAAPTSWGWSHSPATPLPESPTRSPTAPRCAWRLARNGPCGGRRSAARRSRGGLMTALQPLNGDSIRQHDIRNAVLLWEKR